jgi:XRE family aerobic/anaerobic benzoate catabolism transcriptional regulator
MRQVQERGGSPEDEAFLQQLGERVRELRARRGMTRRILANDSGVSERYLALLESGRGNASVLVMRALARAFGTTLDTLLTEQPDPPVPFSQALELLRGLHGDQLSEARELLVATFGDADFEARRHRIALVGLRGAGKTTLGSKVAERLGVPFIELDRQIERESGISLATIFDLYGQAGFRRFERQSLERIVKEHERFVLTTGGSIVSETGTFERLLASCYTIWVRATPGEHMERVVAQGDMRPMAGNRESMDDLQRILAGREKLYQRADAEIATTGRRVEESVAALLQIVKNAS